MVCLKIENKCVVKSKLFFKCELKKFGFIGL